MLMVPQSARSLLTGDGRRRFTVHLLAPHQLLVQVDGLREAVVGLQDLRWKRRAVRACGGQPGVQLRCLQHPLGMATPMLPEPCPQGSKPSLVPTGGRANGLFRYSPCHSSWGSYSGAWALPRPALTQTQAFLTWGWAQSDRHCRVRREHRALPSPRAQPRNGDNFPALQTGSGPTAGL